jgi:hypothetical protein
MIKSSSIFPSASIKERINSWYFEKLNRDDVEVRSTVLAVLMLKKRQM